jgi:transcriptional regulator GlxA family with amidase domain
MAAEPAGVMTDVMTPHQPAKKVLGAVKVAQVRAEHPALPQEEVAKRAGVSVRTVARHWATTAPATA